MDRIIQKSGFIKKELLLLKPFVREPWKEFTLTQIKQISRVKSHHYAYDALKKFVKLNVLNHRKQGNTATYSLNYNTDEALFYAAIIESLIKDERSDIPYKNLALITAKIKSPFYSLLITGSYAEKKQKPTSDIDVVIIIPDREIKKQYETALKGELVAPEVHGFVFTYDEFYNMLINREFNLGKETARKHIAFYGAESYYKILFEAMKLGFKG
jgi:predicted nucleotidyltransferase